MRLAPSGEKLEPTIMDFANQHGKSMQLVAQDGYSKVSTTIEGFSNRRAVALRRYRCECDSILRVQPMSALHVRVNVLAGKFNKVFMMREEDNLRLLRKLGQRLQ